MDRQTFRRILLKSAFRKRKMYETLLDNVPMLKALQVWTHSLTDDRIVQSYIMIGIVVQIVRYTELRTDELG